MSLNLPIKGKRDLLARGIAGLGLNRILRCLPAADALLVFTYHRIGSPEQDSFDPGVFSATATELDEQIEYLKTLGEVVDLSQATRFLDGNEFSSKKRCRILLTFDDGYLDNYEIAFPILKAHCVSGVFFLATSFIGSTAVPWWDRIAFTMKSAQKRQFTLYYPDQLEIDIERAGFEDSLRRVLALWKRPSNVDHSRFLRELEAIVNAREVPGTKRRFLDWNEAKEMIAAGMAIGSHTLSHEVLSQLTPDRQVAELSESRSLLSRQLNVEIDSLAYPVGHPTSFSDVTKECALKAGYRVAFSHYGGINLAGRISLHDVKRNPVDTSCKARFHTQATICRAFGNIWP